MTAVANSFGLIRSVASESEWTRYKANGNAYTKDEEIEAHRKYHEIINRFKHYRDDLSERTGDQVHVHASFTCRFFI